jgi:hypothetical protein
MPSASLDLLVLAGALTWAAPLAAQHGKELGIQAIATGSDPALGVIGVYGAIRPSTRTRVSLTAGPGVSDGDPAFRGEALGHFLLSPGQRRGAAFYLAGGVAAVAGPVDRGYLVLALGLEARPGGESGWGAELGVGGGVRLMLGYRWRWLQAATR